MQISSSNVPTDGDSAPRRVDVLFAVEATVVVVFAVATAIFVSRIQEAIGITVTAICLAVVLSPVQRWMERGIGHVASMVATVIGTLAVAITAVSVVLSSLHSQATAIAELTRQRIDGVEPGSLADRAFTALDLNDAIDSWLSRIPNAVIVGEEGSAGVGQKLVALLAVVILAVFFQSSGRGIVDWIVARWPRVDETAQDPNSSPRVAVRRLLLDAERRGVGYVRRTTVLAATVAVVVGAACGACGIPGALVIGLWAGAWFVVPVVGVAIGAMPVALLVWLDWRPLSWLGLALTLAAGIAAMYVRKRWIERGTMRLGVGPYVVSVGLGIGVAGLAGSFCALVIGAVVCAMLTNADRPGRPTGWLTDARHSRVVAGVVVPTGWRLAVLVTVMASSGVLLWTLMQRVSPTLVWLLVGGFVAIAISRPVAMLERRSRLSHHAASAIVLTLLAGVLLVITVSGIDDGARATTTVTEQLPEVVAELEDTQLIGPWLRDRGAAVWVDEQMNDLPDRLSGAQPEQWLPTVGARLVDLFAIGVFAIALLVDGPRLSDGLMRRVPARHRRQYRRIVVATGGALAGYAAGSALVAAINATVVFTLAVALGIGLAPILATWAFLWNFVPQIGGFMGGVPLILFALIAGPLRGLIAGLLYLVYQLIENHVIQPTVIGAAIDVAPWGTMVAALIGAAAAGVIGAIVITPLVGVVRVIRSELRKDDFPGVTVRVDPESGSA